MRNDRQFAVKLRREGKSYNEISRELGITKSTLSDWFSASEWSQIVKNTLTQEAKYVTKRKLLAMNKARGEMWEAWREDAREEARREFSQFCNNPLFIAGIMLYWGEGDSNIKNGKVRLANTNSNLLRIFALFLQRICQVEKEKIKVAMILYPDLNEEECKKFWNKVTGISKDKFIKASFIQGRHPTKRLPHGVCSIYVYSRALKEKIVVWIELFHNQFQLRA